MTSRAAIEFSILAKLSRHRDDPPGIVERAVDALLDLEERERAKARDPLGWLVRRLDLSEVPREFEASVDPDAFGFRLIATWWPDGRRDGHYRRKPRAAPVIFGDFAPSASVETEWVPATTACRYAIPVHERYAASAAEFVAEALSSVLKHPVRLRDDETVWAELKAARDAFPRNPSPP